MIARKKPQKTKPRVRAVPGDVIKPGKKQEAKLELKRGKETRKYSPIRELTGDPRYGKESPSNKDPDFVERARAAKVDVVRKDGKPYRAGVTTVTKEPDKVSSKIEVSSQIRKVQFAHADGTAPAEQKRVKKISQPKRRLKRVDYLQGKGYGRNKRTESGYGR